MSRCHVVHWRHTGRSEWRQVRANQWLKRNHSVCRSCSAVRRNLHDASSSTYVVHYSTIIRLLNLLPPSPGHCSITCSTLLSLSSSLAGYGVPSNLSGPHNCNKTKIKELYKFCRTLAADQALLDIMHEQESCSQLSLISFITSRGSKAVQTYTIKAQNTQNIIQKWKQKLKDQRLQCERTPSILSAW